MIEFHRIVNSFYRGIFSKALAIFPPKLRRKETFLHRRTVFLSSTFPGSVTFTFRARLPRSASASSTLRASFVIWPRERKTARKNDPASRYSTRPKTWTEQGEGNLIKTRPASSFTEPGKLLILCSNPRIVRASSGRLLLRLQWVSFISPSSNPCPLPPSPGRPSARGRKKEHAPHLPGDHRLVAPSSQTRTVAPGGRAGPCLAASHRPSNVIRRPCFRCYQDENGISNAQPAVISPSPQVYLNRWLGRSPPVPARAIRSIF